MSRRSKAKLSRSPQEITEAHPNPHGEQDVAEMPLQTNHTNVTSENVGQTTSTRGNRMNPTVTGPLEDPTTDSMFNLADPQTREIEETEEQSRSSREKTRKKRKIA